MIKNYETSKYRTLKEAINNGKQQGDKQLSPGECYDFAYDFVTIMDEMQAQLAYKKGQSKTISERRLTEHNKKKWVKLFAVVIYKCGTNLVELTMSVMALRFGNPVKERLKKSTNYDYEQLFNEIEARYDKITAEKQQEMKDLFGNQELRALSWKDPYGSLMPHGKIETRTWDTKYRGLVLICLSKKPYSPYEVQQISGDQQFERIMELLPTSRGLMNCGKAIAIGELVDCRPMAKEDEDACFVEYREGLYCHIYKNVQAIEPIPFKGQQGWKRLDNGLLNQIEYL